MYVVYDMLERAKAFTLGYLFAALITALLISAFVFVVLFFVNIIFMYASARKSDGILGNHIYSISDEGFRESTAVNETLHRWSSVRHVYRSKKYIFIRVSMYLFHIVPRRSFSDNQEFDCFYDQLTKFQARA